MKSNHLSTHRHGPTASGPSAVAQGGRGGGPWAAPVCPLEDRPQEGGEASIWACLVLPTLWTADVTRRSWPRAPWGRCVL